MKAVVIGTGFESLASALRLRALGYEVDVLEADASPGGWVRAFHLSGHTFEAAPPIIHSPWLFDELFELFKERRADLIEFLPSSLYRRNVFADGSHLDIVSSIEGQESEIATLSPRDASRYRAFLEHCERLARNAYANEGDDNAFDLKAVVRSVLDSASPTTFSNMWRMTGRYFTDRRVRQAFSWYAVAAGLNPLVAPGHCIGLHAAERNGGAWVVRGGLSALVRELVSLAERHGVRFHYDHTVASFARDGAGRISAVYSARRGERVVTRCDLVVWGGGTRNQYPTTQRDTLSSLERIGLRADVPSFGMYILFLATKRAYPEVRDHTVVYSDRWEGLLSQIGKGVRLPKDPMFSVQRLSVTPLPMAREEGELFSVSVPVPHLGRYSGWKFDGTGFKDALVTKLEERVFAGLRSHLILAESVDPRYARDVLHHPFGAPFPAVPDLWRGEGASFHHRMRKISNLYLCGAKIAGGCGVAGAVTAARCVAEVVAKEFPASRPYERLTDIAARSVA